MMLYNVILRCTYSGIQKVCNNVILRCTARSTWNTNWGTVCVTYVFPCVTDCFVCSGMRGLQLTWVCVLSQRHTLCGTRVATAGQH